jgi:hypothetical protein
LGNDIKEIVIIFQYGSEEDGVGGIENLGITSVWLYAVLPLIPEQTVRDALDDDKPRIELSEGDSTVISEDSLQAIKDSGKVLEIELPNGIVVRHDDGSVTVSINHASRWLLSSTPPTPPPTWQAPGLHTFNDVPKDRWPNDEVSWAQLNGITTGTSPTTFSPGDNITREQIAAMLYRYLGYIGDDEEFVPEDLLDDYTDQNNISQWAGARDGVTWAVYYEIMGQGIDWLAPRSNATRAQAVTMLYRVVGTFNIPAP